MKIDTIVIVNDFNYVQGGASKVAVETARLLKDKGFNVIFFSAVNKKECEITGVTYISTNQQEALKEKNKLKGMINGIYNIKAKRKFKDLLDTLDKDRTIIHVHGWTKAISSSIFDVAFKMNFKLTLTLHDYFSICPNGGFFHYNKNQICKLKPLSSKCIFCNCDSRNYFFKVYRIIRQIVQNKIVKLNKKLKFAIGISDLNINVLKQTFNKNIVIQKICNPITIEKENEISNNKIDISKNKYYLYVGRVAKEKGVDIFCDEIVKSKIRSIVVGDGAELKRLKEKYNEIEFVGWKNSQEVSEYMKNARLLVLPSLWYEGAPLTPLEAMSYGIPCVISKYCSATEYIQNNNGKVFDPFKDGDLLDKINDIEADLEKISDNAYQYFQEKIKSIQYINELIQFYEKME